jgi:hypothetical protein
LTTTAIDLSNLQNHPDTWPGQPWYPVYQAATLVIVQAIVVPPGYPGHDFIDRETGLAGYTGVQLRRALADGKAIEAYVWLWNGLADTQADIRRRLSTVPPSVYGALQRAWIDVEDTSGGGMIRGRAITPTIDAYARTARQLQCEGRPG